MEVSIVLVALIAWLAFRQWLQLRRRSMIHRERLAAIEKGTALPPVEEEVRRNVWAIQNFLLLLGLIWISLGIGAFVTLSALIAHPTTATRDIPQGLQWIGLGPACIGISHLVVYLIGKNKES